MKNISLVIYLLFGFWFNSSNAQTTPDSTLIKKDFFTIEEALKSPTKVYRLTLGSSAMQISDTVWAKFTNLEYLSLKNDHLKRIPNGVGLLKNLKVLDLSGNDFKRIPQSFGNLSNLQELYLNDEKNFQLKKNISILSKLPHLTALHLENDKLVKLPNNIDKLSHLEALYLNNNNFKQVPTEIKGLKSLKYLDFHDNKVNPNFNQIQDQGFGVRISF